MRSFFRSQKLYNGRLDNRHQGHIAESRHRQRCQKIGGKFLGHENGGGTVGGTDDTDGRRFIERKSRQRCQEGSGKNAEMGSRRKEHHIRRPDQGIELTHGSHRNEDEHREELIGNACLIKHGQKARLSAACGNHCKMTGNIGQNTAYPHGEKKHGLIILFHPQINQDTSNEEHHPHRRVSHAHDPAEQLFGNTFPGCH